MTSPPFMGRFYTRDFRASVRTAIHIFSPDARARSFPSFYGALARNPSSAADNRRSSSENLSSGNFGPRRDHPSPQLRTREGTILNMTRLAGMDLPPQSRSRPRYFAWKRTMSARRSGPSDKNSARPY